VVPKPGRRTQDFRGGVSKILGENKRQPGEIPIRDVPGGESRRKETSCIKKGIEKSYRKSTINRNLTSRPLKGDKKF
jgi:hypothetical protein